MNVRHTSQNEDCRGLRYAAIYLRAREYEIYVTGARFAWLKVSDQIPWDTQMCDTAHRMRIDVA